ncbi:hypothetical protein QR680_018208 [Steinernema hermaphroditum]|uniref:G-protein coupled receptors family 1 profile domain-containing protein n=1 Tax=Steinernema hermaphroditum TaxID=289476 RepID=A0AA39HH79_9BILA|nr:hypothetical protein QR680_018208 [Steinernema hermaphroditum]
MDIAWKTILGVVIFVSSALFFFIHVFIVTIIIALKKYAEDTTHIIIAHISIAAAIQLFCLRYSGLVMVAESELWNVLNKILGAIDMHVYTTMYLLLLVLAVNRLAIFTDSASLSELKRKPATYIMILLSWLLGGYFSSILMTPLSSYTFSYDSLEWQFEENDLFTFFNRSYISFVIPPSIASLFLYMWIGSVIYRKRKHAHFDTHCRPELKFLLFNAIVFGMETTVIWMNVFRERILPRPPISGLILTIYWIFECGLHAVVLLVLDSGLRRRMLRYVPVHMRVSTTTN